MGQPVHPSMPVDELRALCDRHHVAYEPFMGPGKLCMELYDALVEPTLVAPTFVIDHPARSRPWPASTATTPISSSASSWSRPGASWPTPTAS